MDRPDLEKMDRAALLQRIAQLRERVELNVIVALGGGHLKQQSDDTLRTVIATIERSLPDL